MDVNALMQAIANLGFPIACCIYLMVANDRLRTTIEDNTKTIAELKILISTIYNKGDE